MTQVRTDWETMNAYVDGELSTAEAEVFERRVAEQAHLRKEIDEIRDLKRRLAQMRPLSARPERPVLTQVTRQSRKRYFAIAASIAAFAVFATVTAAVLLPERTTWIDQAQALHEELARHAYVVEERHVVQTISSGHVLDFRPPDLTASRLYLVDIAGSDAGGRETIAIHYRGLRGCRLTIVAIEGGDIRAAEPTEANSLMHTWLHGGFAFAVIANGMDGKRFSAVADYAELAIGRPSIDDDPQRVAMADTQRQARPCA